MGLLDEFEKAQSKQKGPGYLSWYDLAVPDLTADQVEALDQALAHPRFTAKAISDVLRDWGVDVSSERVSRLRRKRSHG